MCDILTTGVDIGSGESFFRENRIVYIEDFIRDDIRRRLVDLIVEREDECKKRNSNSVLSALGQLNARNNSDTDKIYKQHSIITGTDIQERLPELHYYYHNCFADTVSKIVGVRVYPLNERHTINNCVIIYEKDGDSLRWHTDRGIFNGKKVFTLLIYLYNSSTQNLCYITHDDKKECIFTSENSCVILEQFTLEHAVTPLKPNEKKILWSMTFAEDMNSTSPVGCIMDKAKQISYMGMSALTKTDIFIMLSILLLIILSIYATRRCIRKKNLRN